VFEFDRELLNESVSWLNVSAGNTRRNMKMFKRLLSKGSIQDFEAGVQHAILC